MKTPVRKGYAPIPKLIPPEIDQWDVFVSRVISFSEIWIRLIGENYSQKLDELSTELELYYLDDKSPNVTKVEVNKYYVAICDESAYRIIVRESYENEALVHFIDYGDDEVLPFTVIKQLADKFYSLPSQALLVNLSGLEYTSSFEFREDVMDKIVGKSYIALVEERDPYYLVLYDTSDSNDVDMNKLLIQNIFSETLYQPIVLKVGDVKEVRICHIDDLGNVFIQLVANPAVEFLQDRLGAIARGDCEISKIGKINFSKIYLIKDEDKEVHRVIVRATKFSKQNVDVNLIDLGQTRTVPTSELFDVADDYDILNSIPSQAVKIFLKDIPPFKMTPKRIKKLREITPPNRQIISKVVEISELPVLELFIRNQTDKLLASINHSIELEDLLDSTNGDGNLEKFFEKLRITDTSPIKPETSIHQANSPTTIMPTCLDEADIYKWDNDGDIFAAHRADIPPIGEKYFEIYVADAANPNNFTVQPSKFLNDLNQLTKDMKQFYDKTKPTLVNPFQYSVYAVKHSDGYWYRAIVHRIFNDNVTVKLCDFGNLDVVTLQKLRPLHKKFMALPFLGIKASLAGIAPKHKDWSVNDCLTLKHMIKGKKLMSVIKEVRFVKEEMILMLEIIDTNSSVDVNISHKLVLDQRAIYM